MIIFSKFCMPIGYFIIVLLSFRKLTIFCAEKQSFVTYCHHSMFINSVCLRPKLVVCPCFDGLFLPFFSWSTSTRDYKREPVPLVGTIFPISWYQKFHLVEQKVPIGGKVGTKFRGMRRTMLRWQEGVRRNSLLSPIRHWESTSVAGVTDILKQIKFDGVLRLF